METGPIAPHMEELEAANSLLGHLPALRAKLKERGYLFFRGILDPELLRQVRIDTMRAADEFGLLDRQYPLEAGIYSGEDGSLSARFETSPLYRRMLDIESFNVFPRQPVMQLLLGGLLEAELLEHRRRIARLTFPQMPFNTTPAHQDYHYIRGSFDTYTCWIPTSDCPAELGGLAVLDGSHRLGFIAHAPIAGTRSYGITEEACAATGLIWRSTHFERGDLLLFHSLTVHKALHNVTSNRLRHSLEYRFQRSGEEIDPESTVFHMKGAFANDRKPV